MDTKAKNRTSLNVTPPLSEPVLDTLVKTNSIMNSSGHGNVLFTNSPLPSSILTQVCAGSPSMDQADYDYVLSVNPPCP